MIAATVSRLLFFGGRYFSLLWIARSLGAESGIFLLSVGLVEFFRLLFDYGLENSILSRFHQDVSHADFALNKNAFRLVVTLFGQIVVTTVILCLCLGKNAKPLFPFFASLQFSCLMCFGYFQAHLQTGASGGMSALLKPITAAVIIQAGLLFISSKHLFPMWPCVVFFEFSTAFISGFTLKRLDNNFKFDLKTLLLVRGRHLFQEGVFKHISALGNVALVGAAYSRFDLFIISIVPSSDLLNQYLLFQRLSSAPLMFFSTLASVSISKFAGVNVVGTHAMSGVVRFRRVAYLFAAISGVLFLILSPFIAEFFFIGGLSRVLIVLQAVLLVLQISNGFHAAMLIALRKSSNLLRIALKNFGVAVILLTLFAWKFAAIGIASALCIVEVYCFIQYILLFKETIRTHEAGTC